MMDQQAVHSAAVDLLAMELPAPARLRLLRELYDLEPVSPEMKEAAKALPRSIHVRLLEREQRANGGWGAFHSRSISSHQKTASTEVAVERAVSLGLDRSSPILDRAEAYILDLLEGRLPFPDYEEKNERWPVGKRLFLASTLALIHPFHSILALDRQLWAGLINRTFQSGAYREEDERAAHADLTVPSAHESYLRVNNRYTVNLVGSLPEILSAPVESAYMQWLWFLEEGIGYFGMPLYRLPPLDKPGQLDRWMGSIEWLLRLFPASAPLAEEWVAWIWNQRGEDGLWDFGSRPVSSTSLPFADSWRRKGSRTKDWSVRILLLVSVWQKASETWSVRIRAEG